MMESCQKRNTMKFLVLGTYWTDLGKELHVQLIDEPDSTYVEFQRLHPWRLRWEGFKIAVSEWWCRRKGGDKPNK